MFTNSIKTTMQFWHQCQDSTVRFERNEINDKRSALSVGVGRE